LREEAFGCFIVLLQQGSPAHARQGFGLLMGILQFSGLGEGLFKVASGLFSFPPPQINLSMNQEEQGMEKLAVGPGYEALSPVEVELGLHQPPLPGHELGPGEIGLAKFGQGLQCLLALYCLLEMAVCFIRPALQSEHRAHG